LPFEAKTQDHASIWLFGQTIERLGWAFTFTAAAYNLARLPKLLATPV
jgi:hypothetical protein